LGQVQRVQRFGNNHLVIAQADVQFTPDSLLSSQQFMIGGGQSIRGFRQNARSGDNGLRFSVEDRIAVRHSASGIPILQLVPFVDLGTVWNRSGNPNLLSTQRFLSSAGLGIVFEPIPNLTIQADYAVPFVKLIDRGNNAQDRGFSFNVSYNF
jgi:hemolysin activation/secretion protein